MTNEQIFLVLISNLSPTNFSFLVLSLEYSPYPSFFSVPISNLIIISQDAVFQEFFFALKIYENTCSEIMFACLL